MPDHHVEHVDKPRDVVNAASRLEDLTVPRSNRLQKLKGDLKDFHSIRINAQWRVIFKWFHGEPYEVRIVDYHLRGEDDGSERICTGYARRNVEGKNF